MDNRKTTSSRFFLPFLVFSAVTCGTLIMVIEVLGSRVIGPFFGVGIFVWTSLIAVTMISLAAGYAAGGIISDRRGDPDLLYIIIGLAGVCTLLIPPLRSPVLKLCMHLGLRTGSFASSLLLFGPSLFLLGCVSPFVIRLATSEIGKVGRTVGGFYALSTLGSVLGTVLTGFVLVAYLRVDTIFFLVGAILLTTAILYFLLLRRLYPAALALVLLLPLYPRPTLVDKVMDNGTRVTVVDQREGFYGNVKVVDYSYGPIHTREMIIDGLVQGGVDMNSGLSVYPFAYPMGIVPGIMKPGGVSCLVIGLGAGIVPGYYARAGIEVDVVDIDPNIPGLARQYFGFTPTGRVYIEDARYFLATSTRKYDYIVLDVYTGDTTPAHLLSLEAFRLIRERLADTGVVAINYIGSLGEDSSMTVSVIRTLEQVFPEVEVYPLFDPDGPEPFGNIAIFAHDGTAAPVSPADLASRPVHPVSRGPFLDMVRWKRAIPRDVPYIILTDEYNPIDCFDAGLKEKVRKNILDNTDWDVLNG